MEDNKLDKTFEIISFFDDCRWHDAENYNMINFYKDGLDDDTMLLTHWLCYITNRQTGFKRIFDVGGFIFSELADKYKNVNSKEELFALLDPNSKDSFIRDNGDGTYSFIGKTAPNELIAKKYSKSIENSAVVFQSRFFPTDFYCILYTLDLLNCEKYKNSLSSFIANEYGSHNNINEQLIQKVLFSLYLLTYHEVGQKKYQNIRDVSREEIKTRSETIKTIFADNEAFYEKFRKFQQESIFQQKRAWCSLRDFLKSPEYNQYFRNALKPHLNDKDIEILCDKELWYQLELPGDTWNNNFTFGNCILGNTIAEKYKNKDKILINIILRVFYNKNLENKGIALGYPEQFDITFDFVPRMCDKNNCDICPIGCLFDEKIKERILIRLVLMKKANIVLLL